jgi:hypothetical protein
VRRQDQGGARRPTVGDTVNVVQRIAAPPGALVQPRSPTDSSLATLLGPPEVSREGDSVRIGYTLSVWAAGRSELVLPGAVVIRPDGRVDTMPDARVLLDVASVLPAGARPEAVTPQAARPWVPRADRTLLPALILLPIVCVFLALGAWAWRRRGPIPPPIAPPEGARVPAERLAAWLTAGEAGLVVDHLMPRLAGRAEADVWREAVAAVRFTAGGEAALADLARDGIALLPDVAVDA